MLSALVFLIIIVKISFVKGSIVERENVTQSTITATNVQNRNLLEACYSRSLFHIIIRRPHRIYFETGCYYINKLSTW